MLLNFLSSANFLPSLSFPHYYFITIAPPCPYNLFLNATFSFSLPPSLCAPFHQSPTPCPLSITALSSSLVFALFYKFLSDLFRFSFVFLSFSFFHESLQSALPTILIASPPRYPSHRHLCYLIFVPNFLCPTSNLSPASPRLPSAISPYPPTVSHLLSCNLQFTGFPRFPGHIVASQRKLAQHSAINNWRRPTWPGTLSLNGLFWEKSMLACEGFIRACRWKLQGHHQCSPLSVLILSCSSLTPSHLHPPPCLHLQPSTHSHRQSTTPHDDNHGQHPAVQLWIKHT